MNNCDNCKYQEKQDNGILICQHIQSVLGLEAEADYKPCDSIVHCDYFSKSNNNVTCKECSGKCYLQLIAGNCPKDTPINL